MVLESLVNSLYAEEHPKKMFFLGAIYFSVGVLLSMWVFPDQASLLLVFLTTLAATPLLYNTMKFEEKKDKTEMTEGQLLKEHEKAVSMYLYLFLGFTVACAFWYVFTPESMLHSVFKVQTQTISEINSSVTGQSFQALIDAFPIFTKILSNNLKVLIFCILFSFLYGAGAIFILTWNATVIGVAIGHIIKTQIAKITGAVGLVFVSHYFHAFSLGLLRYIIHGVPEVMSYLFAGLAGGIISVAVIKHDFGSDKFEKIIMDSSVLILISLALVVFAAFLEVYVTPFFFM